MQEHEEGQAGVGLAFFVKEIALATQIMPVREIYETNVDFVRNFRRFNAGQAPEVPEHLQLRPEMPFESVVQTLEDLCWTWCGEPSDEPTPLSSDELACFRQDIANWFDTYLPNVRHYFWRGGLFEAGSQIVMLYETWPETSGAYWARFYASDYTETFSRFLDDDDYFRAPSELCLSCIRPKALSDDWEYASRVDGDEQLVRMPLFEPIRRWINYVLPLREIDPPITLSEYFAYRVAQRILRSLSCPPMAARFQQLTH